MKKSITVIVIFTLTAGVLISVYIFGFVTRKIEVSENSTYLFSEKFNPNKTKVYGISIGDSKDKISTAISDPINSSGWIHTTNDVGYRISNGKVVEMVLNWEETKRLGLIREDEITLRFGKADKVEKSDGLGRLGDGTNYTYINKGLIITYTPLGITINIVGKY